MKKFLLISSWAPPIPGGSAVVLGQLLSGFPADAFAVLTDSLAAFAGLPSDGWLPAPHYFFGNERRYSALEARSAAPESRAPAITMGLRGFARRATHFGSHFADVTSKLRDLTRSATLAIEREDPEIVLTVSGDPVFVVAAALAARATGRSLYVHLFDLLAGNRYSLPKRTLASRAEREVLTQAKRVFVPNPAMAAHYRDRYGISPVVVPNGTMVPPCPPERAVSDPATILYTGAVYWAQRDSLRNLVRAIDHLDGVMLELRTNASASQLGRVGLRRGRATVGFSNQGDTLLAQRTADILFLPLAFRSSAPDVIRTALPGKTAEYLASGTPILVHAPPDAYISQYARTARWGYVVDTLETSTLIEGIKRLLGDARLRASLVTAAHSEALRTHDLRTIVPAYVEYFS